MAKQTINIGASPNDGTGTPLRTAFDYTNQNFTELYTATGPSGNNIVVPGSATITGDLTVDTSTLKVDSTNNRVGIGTASPTSKLHVSGSGTNTFLTISDVGANYNIALGTQNADTAQLAVFNTTIASGSKDFWLTASSHTFNTWNGSAYSSRFVIASDGVATWSNVGGVAGTAMTLNANGLGIGVTPNTWTVYKALQVNSASVWSTTGNDTAYASNVYYDGGYKFRSGSSDKACMYIQFAGQHQWHYTASAGTAGNTAAFTQGMTLDASGNLLVGTTTNTNGSRVFVRGIGTSPALALQSATGDVAMPGLVIGKFDNNSTTSQIIAQFTINNGAAGSGQINANGASQAAFGSYSDSRLKENIISLPSQLANILSLRPVEFDYKDGSGHQIGFVAQEMQEVYSDAVGEQNGFLTVTGWSKTEARLVSAIKELAAKVQALEAKLA